jgi:hypothetical protein
MGKIVVNAATPMFTKYVHTIKYKSPKTKHK